MKIIFAGTPVFAATALDALIQQHHDIVLVLTQPDRPAGRGMKVTASAVKLSAQTHGLKLLQPQSLKDNAIHEQLRETNADLMIVAAYGLILPESVLTLPRLGCLNIHASLLPRWRGAAPIQRAILAGDHETGITIMQMDAGLDTGPMLLKESIAIAHNDTAQTLHDKLSQLGAHAIIKALTLMQQNRLIPTTQDEALACYAAKISKNEALIDWNKTAAQIDRTIRAYNPAPGAYTTFRGYAIKIWQASIITRGADQPGKIIAIEREGIIVACGTGLIRLEMIQKSGGKRLSAAEFLAGFKLHPGDSFDTNGAAVNSHG
ncbi:MAG: methionyl-tRNA formyltransferase [Nitrosomonas sp.]|nr:methionyl-tRNA formyltransferase [Nitrosomonas sp.]